MGFRWSLLPCAYLRGMFHIRGFELGLFRTIVPEDASVEYRMILSMIP